MKRSVLALLPVLALVPAAYAADSDTGYWEYRLTDPATNLALLALIIFLGIVWYVGGFKFVGNFLDKRAEGIKNELEEARKLRDEAKKILADTEKRQKEAEAEADAIITRAKQDAKALAEQSARDLEARMKRREQLAEERIARAEAEATDEVRRAAADAATEAARRVLSEKADAGDQFDRAVSEIEQALSRH
jgi:F-type H+-transporting ATPase subunit b